MPDEGKRCVEFLVNLKIADGTIFRKGQRIEPPYPPDVRRELLHRTGVVREVVIHDSTPSDDGIVHQKPVFQELGDQDTPPDYDAPREGEESTDSPAVEPELEEESTKKPSLE